VSDAGASLVEQQDLDGPESCTPDPDGDHVVRLAGAARKQGGRDTDSFVLRPSDSTSLVRLLGKAVARGVAIHAQDWDTVAFIDIHQYAVTDSVRTLAQQLDQFAKARDWQQFHSPKNLASALIVEAGELLEHFQWMTEEQSRNLDVEKREAVGGEIADVLLYLIQLSTAVGIDPIAAAQSKLKLNGLKYPADMARGNSRKYNEL
jgi:NTP pyrophosphatase (non-canonical NTP hydrolase)